MTARRPPPPTARTRRVEARSRRLEARLILGFGGVGLAIMLLVVGLTWAVGRRAELHEERLRMQAMTRVAEGRLWLTFGDARALTRTLARFLPIEEPAPLLRGVLQEARTLEGLGVAQPGREQVYVHRVDDGLVVSRRPPGPLPLAGWTGPGTDLPSYSVSAPLEGGGAVWATVGLGQLRQVLREIPLGEPGYFLALDREGRLLVFPDAEFLMQPAAGVLPQDLVTAMAGSGAGLQEALAPVGSRPDQAVVVAWRTEPETGIRIALVRGQADIFEALLLLNLMVVAAALVGGALLLTFVVVSVRRLTRPLRGLMLASDRVAHGDLDVQIPESDLEELSEVFTAFNGMVADLRRHLQELQEATRQQERARRELEIASEIQESFLRAAPMPLGDGFEMAASCQEAGQVGGDFYDHFPLSGGGLAFCLADASGKGVPAALVMAVCRTLVRACAHLDPDPARCLREVNQRLCEGNRMRMFVTCVYGVLEPGTGRIRLCNAGHAPPLLMRADGGVHELPRGGNRALGVRSDSPFESQAFQLEPGDALFLFSDGLNEALDPEGELFGLERVEEALRRHSGLRPPELLAALEQDLAAFTRGAPPSDDRTLLALRRVAPPSRLTVASRIEEVERAQEWLSALLGPAASGRTGLEAGLALEELLVNVIRHGGAEEVRLEGVVSAGSVEVRLEDEGPPFDPTDPPAGGPEPRVGGWGLRLAAKSVDTLTWRREGDRNVVIFRRRLEAPDGPDANAPPSSPGG